MANPGIIPIPNSLNDRVHLTIEARVLATKYTLRIMKPIETLPTQSKCSYITKKQESCKVKAMPGYTFCHLHNPSSENIEKRRQIAIIAGSASKKVMKLTKQNFKATDASSVKKLAGKFLEDVATGKMPMSNMAIATLPKMMKVFLEAHKLSDIEKKLEAVARLQQQRK